MERRQPQLPRWQESLGGARAAPAPSLRLPCCLHSFGPKSSSPSIGWLSTKAVLLFEKNQEVIFLATEIKKDMVASVQLSLLGLQCPSCPLGVVAMSLELS